MHLSCYKKTSIQMFSTLLLLERETVRPSMRTSIYPSDDESEAQHSSETGLRIFTFSSLFLLSMFGFPVHCVIRQIVNKTVRILQSAIVVFFHTTSDLSSSISVMLLRVLHYALFLNAFALTIIY